VSWSATGGVTGRTWSATGLPAGITITSAGLITGSATTRGSRTVTLTGRTADGTADSVAFVWTVT
jgi:Fe-S cluster assembly scaffold protein SufB